MTDLGFKTLTVENWLEPDGVPRYQLTPDGSRPMTGEDWVSIILTPTLIEG